MKFDVELERFKLKNLILLLSQIYVIMGKKIAVQGKETLWNIP